MYNFDKTLNRYHTEVIKWDRLAQDFGREGLLPFGIADMDFEVLPELQEAMVKRAEHPTYGYTFPSEEYFNSFIHWNHERNNFDIRKEEIVAVPGIVCAFSFIVYALTAPGDQVLVNTPAYDPFFNVIKQQKRKLVTSGLILQDGTYTFDLKDMEERFKEGVKLLVLCNPHNPVGRVWQRSELEAVVALCHKYGVKIFSDEIHCDLIFPGHHHIPLLALSEQAAEISLLAMAPSKTFNVAGLKSSFMVAKNPEIREKISEAITAFHVGVNLFGLKATEVAYSKGAQWTDELVAYLYENAKMVDAFVKANLPRVKTYVPDGTYLMWLDFSDYGLTQEDLMAKLVEAGVALNDGSHYGDEGAGFARINIGTPRSVLTEGMERIRKAFA